MGFISRSVPTVFRVAVGLRWLEKSISEPGFVSLKFSSPTVKELNAPDASRSFTSSIEKTDARTVDVLISAAAGAHANATLQVQIEYTAGSSGDCLKTFNAEFRIELIAKVDCVSNFKPWICNETRGSRSRDVRIDVTPQYGGRKCKEPEEDGGTWGEWSQWSECVAPHSTQSRNRSVEGSRIPKE